MEGIDVETVDVTMTTIGVGIGTHTALTESVSTYARIGYVDAEVEAEWATEHGVDVSVSTDGNGYSLGAGIRALGHCSI